MVNEAAMLRQLASISQSLKRIAEELHKMNRREDAADGVDDKDCAGYEVQHEPGDG